MKKETDKYYRWVAWSEEDQVYIGHCPDLFSVECTAMIPFRWRKSCK